MTGQTVSTLTCDRDTRPPIDGMRTICGTQLQAVGPLSLLRQQARRDGWVHRGRHDYCKEHA